MPKHATTRRSVLPPATIDALVLSHAHIGQGGRVPLLVRRGFRGAIHTHAATADLLPVM